MLRLQNRERSGGAYFLDQRENEFTSTGAAVLDRVVGGGWAGSRFVNIIGDKAVGKTLLALEACINFCKKHPKGRIRYREPEAALGKEYAKEMGAPVDKIEWDEDLEDDIDSVEDFAEDFEGFMDSLKKNESGLYILDSLDAIDSEDEKKRGWRKASTMGGGGKPKLISRLFRNLVRKMKHKRVLLIIISQVRENIGVSFGAKYTRTGGKALDFYASQIVWLANVGKLDRVISGVKRTIGNKVKVYCSKNKVGIAHRECELDIRFGYGIDDVASNVKFLASVGKLGLVKVGLSSDPGKVTKYLHDLEEASEFEFRKVKEKLNRIVPEVWMEVEKAFLPTRRKYK